MSGRSLAEFATDRLFGPLGMRATRFRDDLTVPVPGLATGYTPAPDGSWRRADITEETVGDGGVVTSISDLAGWQHFMLTGATLGADIRDALLEPAVLADGRRLPYALGLEITTVGGRRVYLHSGHIDGFRSALAHLIDAGVGVAVLANRDDTFPAEIAVRIAERLTGVASPAPPARLARRAALAAQPAVTGLWYSPELDVHLTLGATDELGYNAVENVVHVHDLHATMLQLLGVDHKRLTVKAQGRDFRLTDVFGNVVKEILA